MNDYYKFLGYTADYRARYERMTWWKLRRQWFKDVIDAVKRKLTRRDDTNLRAVLDYKDGEAIRILRTATGSTETR